MRKEPTITIDTERIGRAAPEFTACCQAVRELQAAVPRVRERIREARATKRATAERRVAAMAEVVAGRSEELPAYAQSTKAAEAAVVAEQEAEREFETVMSELARQMERLETLRVPAFKAIGGEGRKQQDPIVRRMAEVLVEKAELERLELEIYETVDRTQTMPTNPLSSRPGAYMTRMGIGRGRIDDQNSDVGCWFRRAINDGYDVRDVLEKARRENAERKAKSRRD
jgi:hypothetical protein